MSDDATIKDADAKMHKCIESTRAEFASIRTGRATPTLLDRLTVEAYGQSVPLKQVAGVATPDARTLVITAWDKGVVGDIRKAIEKSDLGLTPNIDGAAIRLVIPPLNEERRRDLVKVIKKKAEEGKIAVRNVRHKAQEDIKHRHKEGDVTEDVSKRLSDQLQKLTDHAVKDIDALVTAKEKEVMEV